ncbi:hypothetical protein TRFO_32711 [Tritrichomonas foetus]|uniref:Uncharacterized protein n=1 Tax=Tritrichomonas foetus TaxID=1144522 RepID=A0A1J4JSW6_9EUKA|nr:hypothetical protein TRFO_32711 [Tritrichomonas foetus]|eukprot:OHT00596.1 hypothetical protein TRFO_32711 [Tritrichomonas foetus]
MKECECSFNAIVISVFGTSFLALFAALFFPYFPFHQLSTSHSVLQSQDRFNRILTTPYTTKWYEDDISNKNPDYSKCPACKYSIAENSNGNSSPKDAIIIFESHLTVGIVPFLRSLRMTSCKAKVFFLSCRRSINSIGTDGPKILELCGVNIIDYGHIDPLWFEHELLLRWSVIYDFITVNEKHLDRILVSHTNNVMFQGDPFTDKIEKENLYFAKEESQIGKSVIEKWALENVCPKYAPLYMNDSVLTAQIVFGGAKPLQVLFDVLITDFTFTYMDTGRIYELGYFMYAAYRLLPNHKPSVNIKFLSQNDGYAGIAFYMEKKAILKPGSFKTDKGVYPHVIYNFEHRQVFLYDYDKMCPRDKWNIKNYMFKIPEEYYAGKVDKFGKPIEKQEEKARRQIQKSDDKKDKEKESR